MRLGRHGSAERHVGVERRVVVVVVVREKLDGEWFVIHGFSLVKRSKKVLCRIV